MIIVAVTAPIKPEFREEMIQATITVQDATRKEPGCITYTFHTQVADPNIFFVFEVWESAEALQFHMQQEHTQTFLAQAKIAAAAPMTAERFEVPSDTAQ